MICAVRFLQILHINHNPP